jgi:small subunit ribosomal protein S1
MPLPVPPRRTEPVPVPNLRDPLSEDLEKELADALDGLSLEDAIAGSAPAAIAADSIPPETRCQGRVHSVHKDAVFVSLDGRNQGLLSLRQLPEPPAVGTALDVIVQSYNAEDGLYSLALPGQAISDVDWSQVQEGMLVEARVTGVNKGGLECEVNRIRGFIPAGQASIYRVEDLSTLVGEKLTCLVTEVKPERRNLVLSRKAVMEREKAESKARLIQELVVGDVREGTVRSIRDFGAFVDLGGVDGLLHVSQLSWARVEHPKEVLQEGQRVRVKIQKIDPATGKISLNARDLVESPWTLAPHKYPVKSVVRGKVTKLMEFGAFVELEPGVEGLVHISQLAHHRVWRVSDVVTVGQEVEAQVLQVDGENQRISLSVKAIQARPELSAKAEPEPEESPVLPPPSKKRTAELKGGLGRSAGGDRFGLNW